MRLLPADHRKSVQSSDNEKARLTDGSLKGKKLIDMFSNDEKQIAAALANSILSNIVYPIPTDVFEQGCVSRWPSQPVAVVGPVVGKVTGTSARILLEISGDWDEVALTLQAYDKNKTSATLTEPVKHPMQAGRPSVFVFENLIPGTYYQIHCNLYVPGLVSAGFRTLRPDFRIRQAHARIAVVSRNSSFFMRDNRVQATCDHDRSFNPDAWKTLYQLASRGSLDLILHAGGAVMLHDEAQGSEASPMAQALAVAMDGEPADKETIICEMFRDVYRRSWTYPFVRHALANCPNVIARSGDELGLTSNGKHIIDPATFEGRLLLRCAHRVSAEYERQLYEDAVLPSTNEVLNQQAKALSHQIISMGDIGILCVDDLTPVYLPDLTVGGKKGQIDDIKFAFHPEKGTFHSARLVLIVTPQALMGESRMCERTWNDDLRHFRDALRDAILDSASNWSELCQKGRRKICLVAPSHNGSASEEVLFSRHQQGLLASFFRPAFPLIIQLSIPPISSAIASRSVRNRAIQILTDGRQETTEAFNVKMRRSVDGEGFLVISAFGHYKDLHPAILYLNKVPMETCYEVAVVPAGYVEPQLLCRSQLRS